MNEAESLAKAIEMASDWVRGRTVLVVHDGLWPSEGRTLGYLPQIEKLLRNAPKSALLMSTRDRNIARHLDGDAVDFESLGVYEAKARSILLKAASRDANVPELSEVENEVNEILDKCAGLPLALSKAASGVNEMLEESGDAASAIIAYRNELNESILQPEFAEISRYLGLNHVIDAGLKHCEQTLAVARR